MNDFTYEVAKTVEDAVKLLAAAGDKGRVLCGGTDILIQMRSGVRRPELLVDVKQIPEMREMSFDPRQGLRLGAAVPCIEIHESPMMHKNYPGLTEAAHLIGSLQIQNRASVGGNLCNASPAADTSPALLAVGARAKVVGPAGSREIPVENFFSGPGRNVLAAGELVSQILVPPQPPHGADAYLRLIPRNEMDIAIVGAGAAIVLDGDRCVSARVGLGAVAPTPLLAAKAAEALVGKKFDEQAVERAVEAVREASSPITDMRGTVEYRRHVIGVLARRALLSAAERARSN